MLRIEIMEYAMEQFHKFGLKKIKVDDLAAYFSISKRTLYEMFENKEQLIIACYNYYFHKNQVCVQNIIDKVGNTLEKYIVFIHQSIMDMSKLNPAFYEDSQKYPALLKSVKDTASERNRFALEFINKCIEEGLFVRDFNYNIVIELMNILVHNIVNSELYKKYGMNEIMQNITMILFRGCCTKKGLEVLDEFLKKVKD